MTDKERIEVYVNKLPQTPDECPCQCDTFCNLHCVNEYGQKNYSAKNCFEDMKDCPLKTIQSVQNQRAVEALEKLKQDIWVDQYDDGYLDKQVDIYYLTEQIDQLIKEYGGKDE